METPAIVVRRGSVTALRLFDIAYAIDLARVEALWASAGRKESSRGSLVHTPSKALAFEVPPVELDLGPVPLTIEGREIQAYATARLYDFGAVALALRLDVVDLRY